MGALYAVPLERGKCAGCCMHLVFGVAHRHNHSLQQARMQSKAAFTLNPSCRKWKIQFKYSVRHCGVKKSEMFYLKCIQYINSVNLSIYISKDKYIFKILHFIFKIVDGFH